jgi:hypothetical protein
MPGYHRQKSSAQIAVQGLRPDLQQQMSTLLRPSHLLLFDHSLADDLIHGR